MQGFDPRFGHGVRPLAQPPASNGYGQPMQHPHPVGPQPVSHAAPSYPPQSPRPGFQPQGGFGQAVQNQNAGFQQQAFQQQQQQMQPPMYQPPQPQAYSQPPQPQAYSQPPQPQAPQPQAHAGWGGASLGLPGVPSFGMPAGLNAGLGNLAGKGPKGLPAPISFGLTLAAVAIALIFDVVFLKIHIPGVGGYAWYLTTALSFAGAGWASIMWTKASKSLATTAMVVAGIVYGIADLGLGLVLEDLSMAGAIILGAQGVAIACVCGVGGIYKALRAKDGASE
jgi:hypothetical protein